MSPSNSAIRSYTQPSCTLQIIDLSTASERGEQPTEAQQQFELRFGEALQQEEQIGIRGDRQQLTELHESVNSYIQNFLGSSSERFNTLLSPQTNIASDGVLHTLQMQDTVTSEAQEIETPTLAGKIFLQPAGRLTHNLFLGSLANPETGQIIQLPTTQLFDLATVLDEHAADVVATPVVNRSSRRAASAPSTAWVSIAAMLLLGVGLTAAVVQLLNRDEAPQTANRTNIPSAKTNRQSIALQPSPTPSLASPDTLPPLPPGVTTSPSPTASLPSGIPTPGAIPGSPLPVPQATPGIPSPPPIPITKTPITSLPGIAQTPSILSQRSPKPSEESISIARPTVPETSRVTALPGISASTDIPAPPPQSLASDRQERAIPEISAAPEQTAHQRLKAALERRSGNTPVELTPEAPETQSQDRAPQTTAFVNTPQLKEVKEYFQKNWQPPSGLTQTLEYNIVLDVDGTIQRIEPLGRAARTYVDRSGLPLIGEPFVSPNSSGDTPRIRVVLSPDGNVQAFAEPPN